MYKGFNLKNFDQSFWGTNFDVFLEKGRSLYDKKKNEIKTRIDAFSGENGVLDGTKMQSNWFPKENADIFLSHSHKDEDLAIALSGWLNERFGLTTFIDSCIWGNSDTLLKELDNNYCPSVKPGFYDYNKRNKSTSHVHMMLSTALSMMIDNVECVIFLNTPNSVKPEDIIERTESPWIYSEIGMTRLIKEKPLKLYRRSKIHFLLEGGRCFSDSLKIEYNISMDHLTTISPIDLKKWDESWTKHTHSKEEFSLDMLYYINQ